MSWMNGERAKSFDKEAPQIGMVMTYPTEGLNFSRVVEIPAEVCRKWLDLIGFRFEKDQPAGEQFYGELPEYHSKYCNNQWLNKMAIIVDINVYGTMVAVYNHDGRHWIITRNLGSSRGR